MSSEVSEQTLESLCLLVADCPHATPKWTDSGVIVLRNQNIKEGRLDLSSPSYTDEAHYLGRIRRAAPQQGDIVITREAPMGDVCQIPAGLKCCLGQRQVLLRPNPVKVDSRFLLYALQSPYLQHQIGWNEGTGSTVSNLRIPVLEALRVPTPSLESQREIATTLGALDDRITLLRETNATLEAIAQALFKSWFVDFDPVRAKMAGRTPEGMDEATAALIPDGFETSELGEVPRGWRVCAVEEFADRVGMGPFGSNIKVETFVESGIPVISGQHLKQLLVEDNTFNFITHEHAARLAKSCVQAGDVIFTHAGSIGQVSLLHKDAAFTSYVLSQRQFFLRCNTEVMSPEWIALYFKSPAGQHQLLANTSQVGVPSIARPVSYLRSIRLLVPPPALNQRFASIVGAINDRVMANRKQFGALTQIRDTLLPRLISGQLRLPEAQAATEAALGGVPQA